MEENRRYGESLKVKIVEEIESGVLTIPEARRRYGITGGSTLRDWLKRYGSGEESRIVRVVMKSEEDRIKELEKALSDEKLGNMLLTEQLRSYQRRVPDLKKKLNSKELKQFEENERKLKGIL
jgi:transposase-like protein